MPQKRNIPHVCQQCGTTHYVNKQEMQRGVRFCSRDCVSTARHLAAAKYIEEDRGYETPCWTWLGGRKGSHLAYGSWGDEYAHRVFYEQKYGPIPCRMDIDHLCKQKDCVNPDHLEPVPHVENLRRGPRTILNWDKVREIRRLSAAKTHTQRQLAEMFGISDTQVGAIIHNQYWRE